MILASMLIMHIITEHLTGSPVTSRPLESKAFVAKWNKY